MNILVLGQGGREHAIVKSLKHSSVVENLYCSPGSDGIALDAICTNAAALSHGSLLKFIQEHNIKLVVVGPEQPLVEGIATFLRANDVAVFGPSHEAAQLEGSKIFSKQFMQAAHIPTAKSWVVQSSEEALNRCLKLDGSCVLKVDGLAAGKGVYVCGGMPEVESAVREIFVDEKFGSAGGRALIEERLDGWELSYLVLTNGKNYEPLCLAQDHKRLKDHDLGPNTGGMGAIAPIEIDENLNRRIQTEILEPIMREMQRIKMDYRGVLYVGLMISALGPKVLEFNVRFGDPEAQVILPLLEDDWAGVFWKISQGEIPKLRWKPLHAAAVVLAAEGYPDTPKKGAPISGIALDAKLGAEHSQGTSSGYLLHAGTKKTGSQWQTNGGRVMDAVGIGEDRILALERAYTAAEEVTWPGMQFRKDIGMGPQ